ncbi:kinase-like domain-containing protein, partial [Rhizophagus irregularis DAOM 181602=DAOM 197198]
FDPTPKLKSSLIPIKFFSFNTADENCVYCEEEYSRKLFCPWKKYCKKCYVSHYDSTNIMMCVHCKKSSQGTCGNCVKTLNFMHRKYSHYCNLCIKPFQTKDNFVLCSNCYLISFEWIESTLFKKQILILYLPWWHDNSNCDLCHSELTFTSDCQKYCGNCPMFYTGCRYCLTTNIIFGLTGQTTCKKCKRISLIIDRNVFDDFFLDDISYGNIDNLNLEIANIIKSIDRVFEPLTLLYSIFKKIKIAIPVRSIPYSEFKDVKEITKGGYGIIYKATWLNNNKTVILKRFENSKINNKYFLNELRSNQQCFNKFDNYIIKTYGFTRDPELEDYTLIMKYAPEGDLHKYLQKNFTNITWNNQKLFILLQITEGLEYIHKNTFVHRDFHSGNILLDIIQWKIGDLGLSQSTNGESSNNEIYGVIPYIAPEIFKGSAFSKETDIYSFGMVMWELTTGCKPFANVEHDHNLIYKILDGERPKITEDTPECYATLMKSCWDPNPKKRPSIKEIYSNLRKWSYKYVAEFEQAEVKRNRLIESKMIGPEFAEKCHPEAIYTSRPLSDIISKCSSINSSSAISFCDKQGIAKRVNCN